MRSRSIIIFALFCISLLDVLDAYRLVRFIDGGQRSTGVKKINDDIPESKDTNANKKREIINAAEKQILTAIENFAKDIPIDRFLEDPILIQTVDRVNHLTKYSIPSSEETPQVIFEREVSDSLKEVVVLSSHEDKLGISKNTTHKNIFALLRRVPNPSNTKPVYYFLFYAYLRPAEKDDTLIVNGSGGKQTIEWDNWDERDFQKATRMIGWTNCASTIFFSCQSNEADLEASLEQDTPSNATSSDDHEKKKPHSFKVGSTGYDANKYYGLFEDFDDTSPYGIEGRSMQGRFLGGLLGGGGGGGGGGGLLGGGGGGSSKSKSSSKSSSSSNSLFSAFEKPPPTTQAPAVAKPSKKAKSFLFNTASAAGMTQTTTPKPLPKPTWFVNLTPTFGSYYPGLGKNPGIFVPQNKGMPAMFVADSIDVNNPKLIYGELFAPTKPSDPMTFVPMDKEMLRGVYIFRGTFIPDGLTETGYKGGIHGSLSKESTNGAFSTDAIPKQYNLDPKLGDPKQVFFNPKLMNGAPGAAATKPTTPSPSTKNTINGMIHEGNPGGLRIFVPDGDGIPGYFLPSDPSHPAFGNAPHGEFYPTKTGQATFIPDIKGDIETYKDVQGAFGPDNMDGGEFIFGKLSNSPSGGVFLPTTLLKTYVYVKGSEDTLNVWAPFQPRNVVTTPAPIVAKSKAPEHYGVLFQGIPQIFFPQGKPLRGVINSEDKSQIHGLFHPGSPGQPPYFEPDAADLALAKKAKSKSKFVPDALLGSKGKGPATMGMPGSLAFDPKNPTKMTFTVEIPSVAWYYNPEHPDEGVWAPPKSDTSAQKPTPAPGAPPAAGAEKPQVKDKAPAFTKGTYYQGVSNKSAVFIPDDIKVAGIIIPDSNAYPQVHGTYVSGKPGSPSTFILDAAATLDPGTSFAGKFFPDGVKHPTQGVKGIFTLGTKSMTEFSFHPETPGKAYLYDPKSGDNTMLWTPHIPGVTPEKVEATTPKSPTEESTPALPSDQGVFGVLYPPVGAAKGIFLPDEKDVAGTFLFDSASYTNMHGKLIAGKFGNPPVFYPDDPTEGATLFNVAGKFMPDWMPTSTISQGIRGKITAGDEGDNCILRTDTVGKAYWYVTGRLETQKIWSPLTAQTSAVAAVRPQNGPTELTENMKPFVEGAYYEREKGKSPVFIPEEGSEGYISPVDGSDKHYGIFYPETIGKFVPDGATSLANGTLVTFTLDPPLDGSDTLESFKATYIEGSPEGPPQLVTGKDHTHCWNNIIALSNTSITRNYSFVDNKWTNSIISREAPLLKNGVAVGGGYKGFETFGQGFQGVLEASSPIFREFLEKRTSKINRESGKQEEVPQNIILISDEKPYDFVVKPPVGVLVLNTSEYREWLETNYMIKRTRIKTAAVDDVVEIAVPKQAEKYIKVKKPWKINLNINSEADAGSGAGAGGNGTSSGKASGGVSGSIGKCKAFNTSANAVALAQNGSVSQAKAHALNGGTANALSKAENGGVSNATANVEKGGLANAMSNSKTAGANADSEANAFGGGKANSMSNANKEGNISTKANAIKKDNAPECGDGGLPDEIVVESTAAANAMGGEGASASAQTQVKIDMAGIVARLQAMMVRKQNGEEDDDDQTLDININAMSSANAGAGSGASGRSISDGKPRRRILVINRSGWKAESNDTSTNDTLLHDDIVFFGLGSCSFGAQSLADIKSIDKPEALVDFYLTILRTGCVAEERVRTLLLIIDGFLVVEGKILRIPDTLSYLRESKLTALEMQRVSRAFELSMFTKTLNLYVESPLAMLNQPKSPDGKLISRSIKFITEHILNCLIEINSNFKKHFVRLTRNSILTLKSVMTKLKYDKKLLKGCVHCEVDFEINYNDQVQITSLLQFIFHGLPPFTLDGQDIRLTFRQFKIANAAEIVHIVDKHHQ